MANIPVERSGGTPWWVWLLGLLLLGLLLWFLIGAFSDDDDDVVEAVDPIETVETAPIAVSALDLSNLYVTRVTGDRTFFVAPSQEMASDETLVILDQESSPGVGGIEGQVDINPGQRVSLTGGQLGPLGDMNLAGMGIPDADLNQMTPDANVVRVTGDQVEILDADMDNVEVGQ